MEKVDDISLKQSAQFLRALLPLVLLPLLFLLPLPLPLLSFIKHTIAHFNDNMEHSLSLTLSPKTQNIFSTSCIVDASSPPPSLPPPALLYTSICYILHICTMNIVKSIYVYVKESEVIQFLLLANSSA